MIIRPGEQADIPRIVELARRFYTESAYPLIYGEMPQEQAAGLVIIAMQGLAEHGIVPGVMLVAEEAGCLVGMACLHIDSSTFNPVTVACDIAWWLAPEHRGIEATMLLLKAVEQAAHRRGADVLRMACVAISQSNAAAAYERMGYAHTETVFTRRVLGDSSDSQQVN